MAFPTRSHRRPALAVVLCVLAASCRSPMADAQMTEQMRQLADELNGNRQDAAAIQGQLDSLKMVVAKQDTVIRQLANLAGVPMPVK